MNHIDAMKRALEFYADPKRYRGANQNNAGDKFTDPQAPYMLDVTRDGGEIARKALSTIEQAHPLPQDGWLQDQNLLYRLNEHGNNRDEINVTMVDGSRSIEDRT
jgi:hypothetical protein